MTYAHLAMGEVFLLEGPKSIIDAVFYVGQGVAKGLGHLGVGGSLSTGNGYSYSVGCGDRLSKIATTSLVGPLSFFECLCSRCMFCVANFQVTSLALLVVKPCGFTSY